MNSVWFILKEQLRNLYLIKRLADFQLQISNHNNYLGVAWEIINPALQIAVYWFVFGLGLRNNATHDGISFIYWLIVGISMWFFVNQGVLEGTKAIVLKYNQVAKMKFPLSVIPSYIVFSRFYGHLGLLLIVLIICFWVDITLLFSLQLLIYVPYALILTTIISILTSTLAALIRDTQMVIQSLRRIIFFVSSILYAPKNEIVVTVMKLNPIYFLAEGYQAALLHKEWYFINHWHLTVYNFVLVLILFIVGAVVHMRCRDHLLILCNLL